MRVSDSLQSNKLTLGFQNVCSEYAKASLLCRRYTSPSSQVQWKNITQMKSIR